MDNIKRNNVCIIVVSEGKEREEEGESLLKYIMDKNSSKLEKGLNL